VEIRSGNLQPGDQVVIDQTNPAGEATAKKAGFGAGGPMGMPHHF